MPRTTEQRTADVRAQLHDEVNLWGASASAAGEAYFIPLSFCWDGTRLTMATLKAGLRIAWDPDTASSANTVNCMGINSGGAAVNHYSAPVTGSVGTVPVFTNDEDVVYATCSFGNSYNNRHVTQVTLQRKSGDAFWVGSVISTFNQ